MGRLQVATASLHCQEEKLRKRIRNVILPVQLHISVLNACIFRPDFGSFSSCNVMKYSSIMQIIFQFGSFSSCKWRLVLVCPRVRVRVRKRVPSNFGPRNRVKEGKRFQEGINAKKDLDKMQDVNQRYLK